MKLFSQILLLIFLIALFSTCDNTKANYNTLISLSDQHIQAISETYKHLIAEKGKEDAASNQKVVASMLENLTNFERELKLFSEKKDSDRLKKLTSLYQTFSSDLSTILGSYHQALSAYTLPVDAYEFYQFRKRFEQTVSEQSEAIQKAAQSLTDEFGWK